MQKPFRQGLFILNAARGRLSQSGYTGGPKEIFSAAAHGLMPIDAE